MKQNLVGKILAKIKIFVQDFVTIVTGIRAGFIVFPGLPLALSFYARALIDRTDEPDDSAADIILHSM